MYYDYVFIGKCLYVYVMYISNSTISAAAQGRVDCPLQPVQF